VAVGQDDGVRTILVTPSGYGHLHPLIPLARALATAGHTVTVATTADLVDEIGRLGLDARSFGPASDPPPFRSFGGPAVDALLAMSEELEPDVFIHDHTVAAVGIAADLRGIPNVYSSVGTMRPPSMMESVEAWFEPVWEQYGLEQPAHAGLFRYLYLDRCPPSLQPPEIRSVETAHAIRPVNFDGADHGALPSWTRGLGDRPIVYVTFGTAFNSLEVFAPVLEAVRTEPVELIVTVGRNREPAELGDQPPNVHVERYLAQSLVLPLCDAVICHGGSGVIMETLTRGLPMVILPQGADQVWNGPLCADRGVARCLQRDEASVASIRDALIEILDVTSYRANAYAVAQEIAGLPALDYAVTLIEQAAKIKAPVLREPAS
jgi:UDP:flavonoid glycosyltransferase YjiC (YdhE family)